MANNSLNLRIANRVSQIAQGDNASTVVLELLDQYKETIPWANGLQAQINFLKNYDVVYQVNTPVFDSRVEFNIDGIIGPAKYTIEVRLSYEGSIYVFPSDVNYHINIAKSSDHYWAMLSEQTNLEQLAEYVIGQLPEGFSTHLSDHNNPHQTSKSQVGLGSVPNYGPATQSIAEAGTNNQTIMTPLRTKQAIEALANVEVTKEDIGLGNVTNVEQASKEEFDSHTENRNNPHGTTKAHVGLTLVNNFGIATQSNAEAGTLNNLYMTPLRTKQAIEAIRAFATQEQAEAGTNTTTVMTPQRVKQAIDANGGGGGGLTAAEINRPNFNTITLPTVENEFIEFQYPVIQLKNGFINISASGSASKIWPAYSLAKFAEFPQSYIDSIPGSINMNKIASFVSIIYVGETFIVTPVFFTLSYRLVKSGTSAPTINDISLSCTKEISQGQYFMIDTVQPM